MNPCQGCFRPFEACQYCPTWKDYLEYCQEKREIEKEKEEYKIIKTNSDLESMNPTIDSESNATKELGDKEIKYEEILNILAPCGSNCRKCVFNKNGEIKKHSRELKKLMGSFDRYAERFSELINPMFKNYSNFKELLEFFTRVDCKGCRNQTCSIYPNCGVVNCYKEKGVDFCFQCKEFLCGKTNFDSDLKRRWILINKRMKEIGIETYCKESMESPRYRYKAGSE